MANVFTRLFGPLTGQLVNSRDLVEAERSALEARQTATYVEHENMRLEESMRELTLYMEDLNWIPVDGWEQESGFPLDVIQREADRIQALLSVNPTIKKAINARIGYIWGRGVKLEGSGIKQVVDNPHNQRVLFSEIAHPVLEQQLATDGNIWAMRTSNSSEITMIPMSQIAGWVVDENDPIRVNYWLRRYSVRTKNFATGVETAKFIEVFYPASGYTGNRVGSIDGIPVDRKASVVHLAANRQHNWILGIPDILASMFWARGHKELFEAGTAFVKAQGRFATKVVGKTAAGAGRAAATIAQQPRRDVNSGEVLDVGGTAVMGAGLDMQLMGKMSGGVDFKSFDPVAALVAVGLGIPLDVILGTADSSEKSLEDTTVNEMANRQKLWTWFYKSLMGDRKVDVIWPKIKTEPEYRRMQSVELANNTNVLHRHELRQLTLEGFGIEGDPNDLPDIEEQPTVAIAKAKAEDAAALEPDDTEKASVPKQGVDAGIGKLSTGADAKASRDDTSDRNTKGQ